VIQYRRFRNTDPPGLVEIWNDALTGRGAVRLRNSSPLESFTLSKLFFDAEGLIVAEDGGRAVGFVHAGFGANAAGTALDYQSGTTCVLAVRASHRGHGIGAELLRRSEAYLRAHGAVQLYAGSMAPLNPFYLGLYGGSELPGFLATDVNAEPFFTHRGYQVCRTTRVLQRRLGLPVKVFDARFVSYSQRFELCVDAASRLGTWWQYNLYNGGEPRVFSLLDRTSQQYAAQATVWEMEGFSFRWNKPAMGLADWFVRPELRRQGIGKYLLTQVLRRAMEELLEVVELHIPSDNQPAWKACQALGFEQVDLGRLYQRID
jgi:ribosomal protein S18 acetylase RimI-like enzyme